MADIRGALLMGVQRTLLGAVPPRLRAVTCEWHDTEIRLRFVFDGELAEDDYEATQVVGAEVIADFPDPWTIREDIIRLDYPADLQASGLMLWAYRREEPAE